MEDVNRSGAANIRTSVPFWYWEGFLCLMLLLSLDGLWSAESLVSHSWFLKIQIAIPWVFTVLAGMILSQSGRRGALTRDLAGAVIMLLGFVVSGAYEVLGKV